MNLSGRENALLNAAFLGLPIGSDPAKLREIIAFAELEDFIDMPVRIYSSGMRARLGFAIASAVEPDILLLDELLGVGDIAFRRKCQTRMKEMLTHARTIMVATHDMNFARQSCDNLLWLDKGNLSGFGVPGEILPAYLEFCTIRKQ